MIDYDEYEFEYYFDTPVVVGQSSCCGANVLQDSDYCEACGEHCTIIPEEEIRCKA